MLSNLPLEVLIRIVSFLEAYEKIAVMQTCKHWRTVLEEHCLLYKVDLLDKTQALDFNNYLGINESKAPQVRLLSLGRENSKVFPLGKLPELFPNLEELKWSYSYFPWGRIDEQPDYSKYTELKDKLRKITSGSIGYAIRDMLKMAVFSKLTDITISLEDSLNHSYSNTVTEDFAVALKNAPNLKFLTFDAVTIHVDVLDKLHENTPNLKELTVRDSTFACKEEEEVDTKKDQFKLTVKPNTTITKLYLITNCSIEGKGIWWLKYISQKYRGLEMLSMECAIEYCRANAPQSSPLYIEYCERALLQLLSGCPKTLKSFYVNRYPMTEKIFAEIDKKGIQLNDIHLEGSENPKVDKLDAFFESQQTKTTEILTVDDLHIKRDISFKDLKSLKHLKISFCGDKAASSYVYLDTLLKNCPRQLEKLEIACRRVSLTRDIARSGVYNIKLLRIFGNVDKSIYAFLNKHCKHITNLGFDLSSYKRPVGQPNSVPLVHMNLSKLSLKLFTFHIRDCAVYCLVKTEENSVWYRLNPKSPTRALRVKRIPDNKTKGLDQKLHIIVECKSVQRLYINALHIY